ncbi:uncharacterized protein LOC127439716 [Myxocyprinus asiaticus]|uniref:uncharacterized protein LOC127439716 n=1 Tax=Myxocyprinus asiaticus TaxID=70543 RepID=UPI0022230404|nr:uncharacterized protein LOC127439716 [Myxocyprinus asiaticus]
MVQLERPIPSHTLSGTPLYIMTQSTKPVTFVSGNHMEQSFYLIQSPSATDEPVDLSGVQLTYHDLRAVFSRSRATTLLPYRLYDCIIELISGTSLPRGRLYSLSAPEREAINRYISDSLAAGLIHPSSSPAGAGFFMEKCWGILVFQGLVNDVLEDMVDRFVFVCLDDILISSQNIQDHVQHIRQALFCTSLSINRGFYESVPDFHNADTHPTNTLFTDYPLRDYNTHAFGDRFPLLQPCITILYFIFRYKERLQTKYLRDLSKKQQLSGALDGRRWRFLSPGQDDFRDGYPTVHKELFTQCKCGTYPAVFGMPKHACSVKLPQKRLSKDQACYSKQNPQSQSQREFIDAVEHRLKQHPLALYPHLESGMTPEGGETNDLTESTILDLFKSDYEKKTSLTFPINKTEPNKTPAKLYSSVEEHRKDQSLDTCFKELNKANKPDRPQTSKTWKKRAANEPLRTPSDMSKSMDFEEELSEQDKELWQIHIIQAFREFIISKGQRMPRDSHVQLLSAVFSDEEQDQRFRHFKLHINT